MNITFKSSPQGELYMDIQELRNLDKTREQYHNTGYTSDGDAYFQSILDLMDWMVAYAKDVFREQTFSDEHLILKVFITDADIKNEKIFKEYIRHCLYLAAVYADTLKKNILRRDHIDKYRALTHQIEYDFEWIVAHYEFFFKKSGDIQLCHWSSPKLSPSEIGRLANNLFYLEDLSQVEDLDFRGMKPYTMFLLRQLLEILGNNLIGYDKIVDKDGHNVPKFTQVAWNFLDSNANLGKWSVYLPLPIKCIAKISRWTNSFVHTTKINSCYLQFYALTVVCKLMRPIQGTCDVFYKKNYFGLEYGDFKVDNYFWLKKDFEHFIRKAGNCYVRWKSIDSVGAYLLSYGKPRVLFIMHMPPPVHGASMVGEAIYNSKLINDNLDAVYFNLATSESIEDIGRFRWGKIWNYMKMLFRVAKSIRRKRPEIVYVTPNAAGFAFYKDFVLVQMLKWMGCNVVAHYHNKGVATKQDYKLDNWLYVKFFKNIKVILLSEKLYEDMKKYVKLNQLYICPNGIPNEHPGKLPVRNNTCPQILFLSNLIKEKGVVDLLDSCKLLNDKKVKFECCFVGAESVEINSQRFNQMVDERGLRGVVKYLGKLYGTDKEVCYTNSDIFVLPTYYHNECFPLVLLEAMSYGLPCISTNEGAVSDIIDDGVTGYVVERNKVQQLADKMELLIVDANLREAMGCAGKKKYEKNYTLQKFEWNLFNILHNIG